RRRAVALGARERVLGDVVAVEARAREGLRHLEQRDARAAADVRRPRAGAQRLDDAGQLWQHERDEERAEPRREAALDPDRAPGRAGAAGRGPRRGGGARGGGGGGGGRGGRGGEEAGAGGGGVPPPGPPPPPPGGAQAPPRRGAPAAPPRPAARATRAASAR